MAVDDATRRPARTSRAEHRPRNPNKIRRTTPEIKLNQGVETRPRRAGSASRRWCTPSESPRARRPSSAPAVPRSHRIGSCPTVGHVARSRRLRSARARVACATSRLRADSRTAGPAEPSPQRTRSTFPTAPPDPGRGGRIGNGAPRPPTPAIPATAPRSPPQAAPAAGAGPRNGRPPRPYIRRGCVADGRGGRHDARESRTEDDARRLSGRLRVTHRGSPRRATVRAPLARGASCPDRP